MEGIFWPLLSGDKKAKSSTYKRMGFIIYSGNTAEAVRSGA